MRLRWCTLPLLSGTLDDRIYTMDKYEKVQEWLMDPDECPTQWPQLHAIRAQNPNYNCRRTAVRRRMAVPPPRRSSPIERMADMVVHEA